MLNFIKFFVPFSLLLYCFSSCNVGLQSPEQVFQTVNASFEYWDDSDVYADTNVVRIYTECEGLKASKKDVLEVLMEESSTTPKNRMVKTGKGILHNHHDVLPLLGIHRLQLFHIAR